MKTLFLQKKDLEIIIRDLMKVQGLTRENSIKEIDNMIKIAEPDAKVVILNEFSAQNLEIKK